ncbi:hypothetical protein C8R46DRAFT_1313453 [Mycena filopes]|nr:hypothetical protein C8R46DRAFT_1313453 [Mycena filopes]
MLALAHASVFSLVVHVSLTAVFLLVFPVTAGRLAGNTSHIYPSSFTPLSADPSSGHGLTTSHITRLPAALGAAGSAALAVVAAATILLYYWVARRAVAAVGVGCSAVAAAVSASKGAASVSFWSPPRGVSTIDSGSSRALHPPSPHSPDIFPLSISPPIVPSPSPSSPSPSSPPSLAPDISAPPPPDLPATSDPRAPSPPMPARHDVVSWKVLAGTASIQSVPMY